MAEVEQKKISCAVIGAGSFGSHYIRILRSTPKVVLSAVVSPSVHERKPAVDPTTMLHTSVDDVFSDPKIDAVIIATPASTHTELVCSALAHGKHVLVEKPVALSYADVEKISGAVKKSGKIFMVGHQYLYNDYISNLKKELEGGRIGTVRYVYAEQLYTGPLRYDVGCFIEAATHEVAILDYLFDTGTPLVLAGSAIDLSGGAREDFATATLKYSNGLFAHIVTSAFSPIKSRRIIFGGDNGMAVFDDMSPREKVIISSRPYPHDEKVVQTKTLPIPPGETTTLHIDSPVEPLQNEVLHFLDSIRGGKVPRTGIAHALRVAQTLDAVTKAFVLSK